MKNVHFAFIRHGHYHQPKGVPSAHLPHPLTEDGRTQSVEGAEKIAEYLKQSGLTLNKEIHSSILLRAFETSTIFKDKLDSSATIIETDRLTERCVGSLANMTVEEIEEVVAKDPRYGRPPEGWKSSSDYRLPVPNAESLLEAGTRVHKYINGALEQAPENTLTLFIGHGASIRHAAHLFGVWEIDQIKAYSMYYAEPVLFRYYDASKIEQVGGQWKVRDKKENHD